jgi:hypothetical protein
MVIMQIKNYNVALRVSTLFLLCFSLTVLAEYVEGIDTTDTNGYGLDSAFRRDTEGKSDFLKGWTRLVIFQDIKKNYSPDFSRSSISFKYIGGKLSVVLNQQVLPVQLDIFTATGKRLGSFKKINGVRCRLSIPLQNIPIGLSLLRAEFPDRSVITQPFTITR